MIRNRPYSRVKSSKLTPNEWIRSIGRTMERQKRCKSKEEEDHNELILFQCAELFLPYLHPTDLSTISSTCKTLNQIANSITSLRSSDASRSLENRPIPFVNTLDSHPYALFIYTPTTQIGLPPLLADACGCDCERCDGDFGCLCKRVDSAELTRECGPSCRCGLECGNRVSQRGISVGLKIVRCKGKGWGLFADQFIRCGQFICEYAGELMTTKEARLRQQLYDELSSSGRFSSALLVVREHLPSGKACMRINIDATRIGNVGRFINHSCDGGNLSSVLVRSLGTLIPRLCFFASRDIQEDEELTFSYGEIRLRPKGLQCFCGTSCCLGMLPSEHT